jgi:hypothetical protein
MSSRLAACALVASATLLGGCAAVDPGMGEALKYDMVAQTVNPDPVYPPNTLQPGYAGTHGQKATERYRKDTVKAIERETTSSGGSGSGSGSGTK